MSTNLLNLKLFWRLPAASQLAKRSSVTVAIRDFSGGLILRSGGSPPIFHGSRSRGLDECERLGRPSAGWSPKTMFTIRCRGKMAPCDQTGGRGCAVRSPPDDAAALDPEALEPELLLPLDPDDDVLDRPPSLDPLDPLDRDEPVDALEPLPLCV